MPKNISPPRKVPSQAKCKFGSQARNVAKVRVSKGDNFDKERRREESMMLEKMRSWREREKADKLRESKRYYEIQGEPDLLGESISAVGRILGPALKAMFHFCQC
jgi:hypothetical protein